MRFSKLISLSLILLLYISGCSSKDDTNQLHDSDKYSLNDKTNTKQNHTEQKTKDNQTPDSLSFETVLTGKNPTSNFSIDAERNFFQLKIINKSKLLITFSLVNNVTRKEILTDQVKPNKILTWNSNIDYPEGLESGKYTIQYRSNGNNMNGIAYGKFSQIPK